MIFELFAKENISFEEDKYKVFGNEILSEYDKKGVEKKFISFMKMIENEQFRYLELDLPKITSNYELRLEQYNFKKTDKTANTALNRIECEEDLLNAYNKLKLIFDKSFSYAEKVIFIDYFVIKREREIICSKLGIGHSLFDRIKLSMQIKTALGLKWENIKNN